MRPETDNELRARLAYITGESFAQFSGPHLDEIAWRYNLKRREVPIPADAKPGAPVWR